MDKPVAKAKRSVENGGKASSRKRRRISREKKNADQEPGVIPMEIDPVAVKQHVKKQPAATLQGGKVETTIDPVNTKSATTTTTTTTTTSTRRTSPRRITVSPQTGSQTTDSNAPVLHQVAQNLLQHKKQSAAHSRKGAVDYPRAPPPSPFAPKEWKSNTATRKQTAATISRSTVDETKPSSTNNDSTATLSVLISREDESKSTLPKTAPTRRWKPWIFLCVAILLVASFFTVRSISTTPAVGRLYPHIVPPTRVTTRENHESFLTNVTLRDYLTHPDGIHLAMAPAFFGFYAYFGMLAAWNEQLSIHAKNDLLGQENTSNNNNNENNAENWLASNENISFLQSRAIRSVAGGSAGAMAAVLIASGIDPLRAANYVSTVTLGKFADPPGILAAFKGARFEALMQDLLQRELLGRPLRLEHAGVPVAVSAFDIRRWRGTILSTGSMARAARASATFPLLFQPVRWTRTTAAASDNDGEEEEEEDHVSYLIDGGVTDAWGLEGLKVLLPHENKRIVNLVVGAFTDSKGPSDMPKGVTATEVLSISLIHTPMCGPWAMANGPRAVEAAIKAMEASLDLPLYKGKEEGHYELHIDASSFVPL